MIELTREQRKIADEILDWACRPGGGFVGLSGPAGVGKTVVVGAILSDLAEAASGEVILSAMTGKASQRLIEATGRRAQTFHSTFYRGPSNDDPTPSFTAEREAPSEGSILVIDEASMMTPQVFTHLKQTWVAEGVKVLLVGDGYQLPPILSPQEERDWGSDFTVFAQVPTHSLHTVMRSGSDILHAATVLRVEGKLLRESRGAYNYERGKVIGAAVEAWIVERQGSLGLITWRNELRMQTNAAIRRALGCFGVERWALGDQVPPQPGEPILARKNGYGLLNGEVVTLKSLSYVTNFGPIEAYRMEIEGRRDAVVIIAGGKSYMDGGVPYIEDRAAWNAYRAELRRRRIQEPIPITWGYTLTAHLSQGSEYDAVMLFLTESDVSNPAMFKYSTLPNGERIHFWRRFCYTAMTRAKKRLRVVIGE